MTGSIRVLEDDGYSSIMVGNERVMVLFDADARIEQVERQTLGLMNSTRIGTAIADYRRERSPVPETGP
ncbi:MAG: hypothetical protein IPJ48_18180 [Propionivibrio sp.]|uniref:Uncharacterized protein n=1 Tax=Candidatus Propionivibrio dominans TaxID=2954373 RepID=A0A9D7FGP8_9RHOO|nr:hypothetical protein [Candidatus Propionivibrio dominans]